MREMPTTRAKERSQAMQRCVIAFFLVVSAAGAGAQTARIVDSGASGLPEKVAEAAFAYLGTPYVYGGRDSAGMDCSGLACAVFSAAAGLSLPRTVSALFSSGAESGDPPRVGDMVFFDTDSGDGAISLSNPSHVGISIGGMRFVHAASEGSVTGVIVSSLAEEYYATRYLGSRGVLPWSPPVIELPIGGDGESAVAAGSIGAGIPIEVKVTGAVREGGEVFITISKNGVQTHAQRLVLSGTKPNSFPIFPDAGTWSVSMASSESGRICSIEFTVGE
jgi:hypothetical protein